MVDWRYQSWRLQVLESSQGLKPGTRIGRYGAKASRGFLRAPITLLFVGILALVIIAHLYPRHLVGLASHLVPKVLFSFSTTRKLVALTFNDAPNPASTPAILNILAEHNVKATFFIVGKYSQQFPQLVDDIIQGGHELGSHMWEEKPSHKLGPERFERQLQQMDDMIQSHSPRLGVAKWFRPRPGWVDKWMFPILERKNYHAVLGSMYAHDKHVNSWKAVARLLRAQVHPGGILILHDGGSSRNQTALVLTALLGDLKKQGYRAMTLSNLFQESGEYHPEREIRPNSIVRVQSG
ncbi:hypothetical protein CYMTET_20051 [Cymbomonas tetramitiformis]|uniref:NodB homology domain-containing protein n=1 Tax=Cymbomonas tetramitiformis TaxID=36881 RepID=A0AAE0L4L6_9CHLO|nr:hypothetical protein CYMTET_20051 [Cymbomonas tetramitiformis]